MDIKDIIIRLLKTFIQGFVGALAVTLPSSDFSDTAVLKSLLIGACAGGISALMNLFIQYLNKGKIALTDMQEEETSNNKGDEVDE